MDSRLRTRKAISFCLSVVVLTVYSSVALAGPGKIAGELTVLDNAAGNVTPFVTVNGETAKSGRSIFSSSTITTSEGTGAVVNAGKLGSIELAPNSNFVIYFDEKSLSGELTSGTITILRAPSLVNIKTADGNIARLNAGEAVMASGQAQQTGGGGGSNWWIWAIVLGAATAGIVYAVTSGNNNNAGGGVTVVSPVR